MYSYTPEDSGGIFPKPYLDRNEQNSQAVWPSTIYKKNTVYESLKYMIYNKYKT